MKNISKPVELIQESIFATMTQLAIDNKAHKEKSKSFWERV